MDQSKTGGKLKFGLTCLMVKQRRQASSTGLNTPQGCTSLPSPQIKQGAMPNAWLWWDSSWDVSSQLNWQVKCTTLPGPMGSISETCKLWSIRDTLRALKVRKGGGG